MDVSKITIPGYSDINIKDTRSRMLSERFETPMDYGAVGDGSTDDSQAMQNFFDSFGDGKIKVFPPYKTYRIKKTLLLNDRSYYIDFNKSTFSFEYLASNYTNGYGILINSVDGVNAKQAVDTLNYSILKNLNIENANQGQFKAMFCAMQIEIDGFRFFNPYQCIQFHNAYIDHVIIENCAIVGTLGDAFQFQKVGAGDDVYFINNHFSSITNNLNAVYFANMRGGRVSNNLNGFYQFRYCENIKFSENHVERGGVHADYTSGDFSNNFMVNGGNIVPLKFTSIATSNNALQRYNISANNNTFMHDLNMFSSGQFTNDIEYNSNNISISVDNNMSYYQSFESNYAYKYRFKSLIVDTQTNNINNQTKNASKCPYYYGDANYDGWYTITQTMYTQNIFGNFTNLNTATYRVGIVVDFDRNLGYQCPTNGAKTITPTQARGAAVILTPDLEAYDLDMIVTKTVGGTTYYVYVPYSRNIVDIGNFCNGKQWQVDSGSTYFNFVNSCVKCSGYEVNGRTKILFSGTAIGNINSMKDNDIWENVIDHNAYTFKNETKYSYKLLINDTMTITASTTASREFTFTLPFENMPIAIINNTSGETATISALSTTAVTVKSTSATSVTKQTRVSGYVIAV